MTEQRLKNKIILVTGATSGIGYATAITLAQQGATIIATGRNQQAGEKLIATIESTHNPALFIAADVTEPQQIDALFKTIHKKYGRLDAAVNNAGCAGGGVSFHETTTAMWDDMFNVNVKSVWYTMKKALTMMLNQQQGSIVNVSSVLGLKAVPWNAAIYTATKHAVIGLTKSAAQEYASRNIRINAVCPGYTETAMTKQALDDQTKVAQLHNLIPMRRIAQPEEIATAIAYLCSNEASYMTGHTMVIDGGIMA